MWSIVLVTLPSHAPVAGRKLTPDIFLRREDGRETSEDFYELNPIDDCFIAYKWFRVLDSATTRPVCYVHPFKQADFQCIICDELKMPEANSFFCSSKCYADAWEDHRSLHANGALSFAKENVKEDDIFARITSSGDSPSTSAGGQSCKTVRRRGRFELLEVGWSRTYVPTDHDIGHVLELECAVVDVSTRMPTGTYSVCSATVMPASCPAPRRMILLHKFTTQLRPSAPKGTFTVLSYNILSNDRAKGGRYNYCPPWALSWLYRRQNLLREITDYGADVICLQQVQNNHFENFFVPELQKHGYTGLYMGSTAEAETDNSCPVEGCATFFYRDRLSLVKTYEVELNEAVLSLADNLVSNDQRELLLSRLPKGNVALFMVLRTKFSSPLTDVPGQELLCVANAYSNTHHELKAVQLFQVHTIVKGIERLATTANIPSVVCGGFNFVPGSIPHAYLATGSIDPKHRDLSTDPFGLVHVARTLTHQLPLVSAYSSFARTKGQRRKMNLRKNEPLFTTYTRNFTGTLDYIFYTADSMRVEMLLQLMDRGELEADIGLPSAKRSSDHVPLLAGFRCMSKLYL